MIGRYQHGPVVVTIADLTAGDRFFELIAGAAAEAVDDVGDREPRDIERVVPRLGPARLLRMRRAAVGLDMLELVAAVARRGAW